MVSGRVCSAHGDSRVEPVRVVDGDHVEGPRPVRVRPHLQRLHVGKQVHRPRADLHAVDHLPWRAHIVGSVANMRDSAHAGVSAGASALKETQLQPQLGTRARTLQTGRHLTASLVHKAGPQIFMRMLAGLGHLDPSKSLPTISSP